MKKATLKDIKEGNFLYMQNEPDPSFLFHPWGNIELKDIPRLKRQIRGGTSLWWIKTKIRETAARLDRFKPWADTWKQRRAEEGFAVNAECVAANSRATKAARWNDLKRRLENAEIGIWEGALDNLKDLDRLIDLHIAEMDKDPILSRAVIPARSWDDDPDPVQDIKDLYEHERSTTGCSPPIIAGPNEIEALRQGVRENSNPSKGFLNKLTMNDKPLECCVGYRQENGELVRDHLAVMESPESFAVAVRNLGRAIMKEFEPVGYWCLGKMTVAIEEFKEAFSFLWCKRINGIVHTPWEMANRILKIEVESCVGLVVPTLEQIDRDIEKSCEENGLNNDIAFLLKGHFREQIEAMNHAKSMVNDFIEFKKTESHFDKTKNLLSFAELFGKRRFPFEPNWLLTRRLIKSVSSEKGKPAGAKIPPDTPEPINLTPYYVAVLVLVALLTFHGLACEFGLVNYAPILK